MVQLKKEEKKNKKGKGKPAAETKEGDDESKKDNETEGGNEGDGSGPGKLEVGNLDPVPEHSHQGLEPAPYRQGTHGKARVLAIWDSDRPNGAGKAEFIMTADYDASKDPYAAEMYDQLTAIFEDGLIKGNVIIRYHDGSIYEGPYVESPGNGRAKPCWTANAPGPLDAAQTIGAVVLHPKALCMKARQWTITAFPQP